MEIASSFKVYNASAGSGKTFTLVKEYLKVLLTHEDIYTFQKILAITFTNKAATEMKDRVLDSLDQFAKGIETPLLLEILKETQLDRTIIKERSAKIVDAILQNYSAFAITTIDSFTYKIIKGFAYDLNLPLNFEVELDPKEIVSEAIDVLISKIGTNKEITKLLIEYSLDKIDDDKAWDITKDLNDIAQVLLNEDDIPHFKKLAAKSIHDFIRLKETLATEKKQLEEDFKKVGELFLEKLVNEQLQFNDFSRSSIPNYFSDVKKNSFKGSFLSRSQTIEKAIQNHNFYTKKTAASIATKIDELADFIAIQFLQAKSIYSSLRLVSNLLKNVTPLAVLNNINTELIAIKKENNIQLNAEFNQLIHEAIKGQPAPFIYERIGQRYQYYFIDEMQDTSVMQWQNLIPLIANALSQEDSLLFLVGDAKQAIYRWRGGKAEQFIELSSKENNPFPIPKQTENLDKNYRSYSEIIDFNNQFFSYLSSYFQNDHYKNIYGIGNNQQFNNKKGGYVSLRLFKNVNKEENTKTYNQLVYEKINHLQSEFDLGEVCIIVRKKEQGIHLATFLSEKGIDVISSDSLLLENSVKVKFVVNLLHYIHSPNDKEVLFECLYFLHEHYNLTAEKHEFINHIIHQPIQAIFIEFQKFTNIITYEDISQLSLYDIAEEIIRGFQLITSSDAYLQFFLDVVLEQHRKGLGLQEFLSFWNVKKDNLSITSQDNKDAVQIMTIHKSKGLEFPVVIFPTTIDVYFQMNPKIWLDQIPSQYHFDEFYINYSTSETKLLNTRGEEMHQEIQESLELDNFNLLYVALTRAVEQLHIISDFKESAKTGINDKLTSGIMINFLKHQQKWLENTYHYEFGGPSRVSQKQCSKASIIQQNEFISNYWKNNNLMLLASDSKLWDTKQGEAIDFGNLLHKVMQEIYYSEDIDKILNTFKRNGTLHQKLYTSLKKSIYKIVTHSELQNYFTDNGQTIYNERAFVLDGQTIIPDRLIVMSKSDIVLIDYKTGVPLESHHHQMNHYQQVFQSANFNVIRKLLVYINDKVEVVEVS